MTGAGKKIIKRSLEWACGPLAHWKLDETSGTTAADALGGHDGTVTGAAWATGQNDGGLDFSSDYVTVSNAAPFQLTEKMTIVGWINGNSWGSGSNVSVILRKGDGNPNNYQLGVVDNVLAFMLDDSDGGGIRSTTTLTTGQWSHVAATWDGIRVRLYIDGVLDVDPATARAAPIATDTRPVYLGGRPSTDYFDGVLDDVCFFNRVLTPKELDLLAYPVTLKIVSWSEVDPNS